MYNASEKKLFSCLFIIAGFLTGCSNKDHGVVNPPPVAQSLVNTTSIIYIHPFSLKPVMQQRAFIYMLNRPIITWWAMQMKALPALMMLHVPHLFICGVILLQ